MKLQIAVLLALLWCSPAVAAVPVSSLVVPTLPPSAPARPDQPAAGAPLSLVGALKLALEHNPDILQSGLAIAQAQAQLHLAEVIYYPSASIDLNSALASTGGVPQAFGPAQQTNNGALTVRQTLSDFGRTRAAIASARATLAGVRADLLTRQEDVALLVEQQYYTAIADEQLATIAEDSVKDQQKHVEQAQGFYQAGTKARIDVAQAEASLAQARLSLVQAANNRDLAYLNLNNAMGIRSVAAYRLDDSSIEKVAQVPQTSDVADIPDTALMVERAYHDRPEMLKVQAQIEAAEASLALSRLGLSPTVSTSGALSLFNANGQDNPAWNVGLAMSIPLLDSNSTKYQIELSSAALHIVQAGQASVENSVFQQVQQDVLNLRESTTSVGVARAGLTSAAEAFRLADGRYQAGLGSSLDFLDAQVTYSQARSALVSAEVAVRLAQSQLDRAVGRTDFIEEAGNL